MDFDQPPPEPIGPLRAWLHDAEQTDLSNPNAMTLATVDPDGRPSARVVLLKGLDERGAVFFTNRRSRKGTSIAANPIATLVFHWDALHRQVIVEGRVHLVDDAESDTYFASRPRGSRIAAWASDQSEPVGTRAELDAAYDAVERRFEGEDVPRPDFWGGYRVGLDAVQFWQARPFRLHDRIVYRAEGDRGPWSVERLYP